MNDLAQIAKMLMIFGVILIVVGGLFWLFSSNVILPRLPGDIKLDKGPVQVWFPLGWSILLSVIITIILNLVLFFLKK